MSGSVSVVRKLLTAGLLDELHLLVHPIAVGTGAAHLPQDQR
jgi:dihydrofolate reductase